MIVINHLMGIIYSWSHWFFFFSLFVSFYILLWYYIYNNYLTRKIMISILFPSVIKHVVKSILSNDQTHHFVNPIVFLLSNITSMYIQISSSLTHTINRVDKTNCIITDLTYYIFFFFRWNHHLFSIQSTICFITKIDQMKKSNWKQISQIPDRIYTSFFKWENSIEQKSTRYPFGNFVRSNRYEEIETFILNEKQGTCLLWAFS
jgi:hypothetical protein